MLPATSAGWQVTLCDLIWHVISRSGVVISITNCYPVYLLTYLLTLVHQSLLHFYSFVSMIHKTIATLPNHTSARD